MTVARRRCSRVPDATQRASVAAQSRRDAALRPGQESGARRDTASIPSLRAQRSNPESFRRGNLDCFAALAMTECVVGSAVLQFAFRSQTRFRILAADLARALLVASTSHERGRREDRVPVGSHRPPCETQTACATSTASNRATGDIPAFPAQWFYGLCRALPGERCTIAPVDLRMADALAWSGNTHHRKTWRTDPGRQDHTISPYANHTCRWREVFAHGCPPCEAFRAGATHVHRRPARVRDDRDAPLFLGPGCGDTYAVSEFR
ncbi:hypothetical protein ACVIIV_004293 [Bradyrhizobium sp. USDA 4354]